jgi:hypothetical protein
MRRLPTPFVAAAVVLAAGCGNPVHSHYSVGSTSPCLKKLGYTVTDASKRGPVEAAATEGAILAREMGNAVVITFGSDPEEAANIKRGYRRFASKRLRPHLDDVMLSQKNAVLRWTITPPKDELDRVLGCLK